MNPEHGAARTDVDEFPEEFELAVTDELEDPDEDFENVLDPSLLPREEPQLLGEEYRHRLPVVRSDCLPGGVNALRPCPWKTCEFHTVEGPITNTCVLDIVDTRGELTLEEVGSIMNLTRERIRQIEQVALRKLKRHGLRLIQP